MTIESRKEVVRLAKMDAEEFADRDSLEALQRAERRLEEAIEAAEAAGEYRRIVEGQYRCADCMTTLDGDYDYCGDCDTRINGA